MNSIGAGPPVTTATRAAKARNKVLPGSLCPGCGARIAHDQEKWIVVQRLLASNLSMKRRVEIINKLFPEDDPAVDGKPTGARRKA